MMVVYFCERCGHIWEGDFDKHAKCPICKSKRIMWKSRMVWAWMGDD
jgi:rubrerythrin